MISPSVLGLLASSITDYLLRFLSDVCSSPSLNAHAKGKVGWDLADYLAEILDRTGCKTPYVSCIPRISKLPVEQSVVKMLETNGI
jgi:hypothetical protein